MISQEKIRNWCAKHAFKFDIAFVLLAIFGLSFRNIEKGFGFVETAVYFLVLVLIFFTFLLSNSRRDKYSIVALLLAVPMGFGFLYMLLEKYGCLSGLEGNLGYEYLYFSYTTFTTLGYGDITPKGICKPITSVEAITGYIFMAYLASYFYEKLRSKRNAT